MVEFDADHLRALNPNHPIKLAAVEAVIAEAVIVEAVIVEAAIVEGGATEVADLLNFMQAVSDPRGGVTRPHDDQV